VCGICTNGVDMVKSSEYDRGLHGIGLKMFGTPNRVTLMIDEYNILFIIYYKVLSTDRPLYGNFAFIPGDSFIIEHSLFQREYIFLHSF